MPGPQQLAIFNTPPLGADGKFVVAWLQYFQSIEQRLAVAPKAFSLTHAQRLTLQTVNVTLGSLVFETDTSHVLTWNGKVWQQLI